MRDNIIVGIIMLLVGAMFGSLVDKSENSEVLAKLTGNSEKLIRIETQLITFAPDIASLELGQQEHSICINDLDTRISVIESRISTKLGVIANAK